MDRDDLVLDYVQGRMSEEQRRAFEDELSQDATLKAEVDLTQALRADLSTQTDELDAPTGGWERLANSIATDVLPAKAANDNRAPIRQLMQMAAAAMLAIGVWQFAVVPNLNERDIRFQTVSEEQSLPTLQVVFRQDAAFGEIAAVLGELDGSIVSGPSAIGVVRVRFESDAMRDAALKALVARRDLVTDAFAQ